MISLSLISYAYIKVQKINLSLFFRCSDLVYVVRVWCYQRVYFHKRMTTDAMVWHHIRWHFYKLLARDYVDSVAFAWLALDRLAAEDSYHPREIFAF